MTPTTGTTVTTSRTVATATTTTIVPAKRRTTIPTLNNLNDNCLLVFFRNFQPTELFCQLGVNRKWNAFISTQKVWIYPHLLLEAAISHRSLVQQMNELFGKNLAPASATVTAASSNEKDKKGEAVVPYDYKSRAQHPLKAKEVERQRVKKAEKERKEKENEIQIRDNDEFTGRIDIPYEVYIGINQIRSNMGYGALYSQAMSFHPYFSNDNSDSDNAVPQEPVLHVADHPEPIVEMDEEDNNLADVKGIAVDESSEDESDQKIAASDQDENGKKASESAAKKDSQAQISKEIPKPEVWVTKPQFSNHREMHDLLCDIKATYKRIKKTEDSIYWHNIRLAEIKDKINNLEKRAEEVQNQIKRNFTIYDLALGSLFGTMEGVILGVLPIPNNFVVASVGALGAYFFGGYFAPKKRILNYDDPNNHNSLLNGKNFKELQRLHKEINTTKKVYDEAAYQPVDYKNSTFSSNHYFLLQLKGELRAFKARLNKEKSPHN